MRILMIFAILTFHAATEPTFAQDVQHNVPILEDADRPAYQWAQANPSGIAIPVRIGSDTLVPSVRVESIHRSDFEEQGILNVRFFFERGGRGDSVVRYVTSNHVWGPYALATAREHLAEVAEQHRFDIERRLN